MADDCINTIYTPKMGNFRKVINNYLTTRFVKIKEYVSHETHDELVDQLLPSGVPEMRCEINLDFNKIIPMPESISLTQKMEFSEHTPTGDALREKNYWEHGYRDWYDWSCENWGTKWNSYYGSFLENRPAYNFVTAWDPPMPVIRKLAQLLDTPIHLEYDNDYETIWKLVIHPDGEELRTFEKY
jgi:hypothetical protein